MDEDGDVARSLPHDLQTPAEADPLVVFPDENVADSIDSSHGGEKGVVKRQDVCQKKKKKKKKRSDGEKKQTECLVFDFYLYVF